MNQQFLQELPILSSPTERTNTQNCRNFDNSNTVVDYSIDAIAASNNLIDLRTRIQNATLNPVFDSHFSKV